MTRVLLLNGPNLNLLGRRQPDIYGVETLDDIENRLQELAGTLDLQIDCRQSNREYELIEWIHEARENARAIIINPAAYSHSSVALLDALNTFEGAVIEVHISNIHRRESFRHHSYVSLRADGVIAGCGTQGYELALLRIATMISTKA